MTSKPHGKNLNKGRNASGNHGGTPRSSRVVHYPWRQNNIGWIILGLIFIYALYNIIRYATMKHVAGYEVRTGSLSANSVYEGIALRQEEVANSEFAGHINYYAKEGDRLAQGKLAYTVDESGKIQDLLSGASAADETVFTDEDYTSFRSDAVSFTKAFSPADFASVYDFKNTTEGKIQKLTNESILADIQSVGESASVHYVNTDETGYMVYSTDGYEGKTFDGLIAADFDSANYEKKTLENNAMVSAGDPAYKMELAEDWSVAILLSSEEEAKKLEDLGVVRVRFLKNNDESWALVKTRTDADGNSFAELSFTNSMVTFCGDRFIDVELLTDTTKGLKIPLSALIDDSFFLVPSDFVTTGNGDHVSLLRQVTGDNGQLSSEVLTVSPYGVDSDGNFYLDQSVLRTGDVLLKTDSNETYTVSRTAKLQGVYNINKGYADFRQVQILEQNEDYAIVVPDSAYGLREYDYIVLDASTMDPNEFIYE